ncbi:MAG: hypothetical protein AUH78_03675 [Gemmatimonadetes bacterium 13_1_40CM_4_69_8]|nr:MAG: hypothetical protein AUH78_03675 [Gemmatimonadetes bacterium 13_1_40CM_4_69_8]
MKPIHLALGFSLVVAVSGAAQSRGLREMRSWGFGGGGVMVGIPVGEFRSFVDVAGGLGGVIAVNLDRRGSVGLRLTGSYLQYGHERRLVPLAGSGGLLGLDLNTAFYIASLRAGPQFVVGEGPVRLYAFGTAGVSYFATESSLGGSGCGCWGYPSTVNYDDAVLALEGGGGLLIKLSRAVALDVGASYVRNGPVTYLREGSISRAADGSLVLRPVRSEADLVVVQLGVAIGLR